MGCGLTLDVVTEHLPVALGASLSKSLSSFAATAHLAGVCLDKWNVISACLLDCFETRTRGELL